MVGAVVAPSRKAREGAHPRPVSASTPRLTHIRDVPQNSGPIAQIKHPNSPGLHPGRCGHLVTIPPDSLDLLDVDFLSVHPVIRVAGHVTVKITGKHGGSQIALDEKSVSGQRQVLILIVADL